MDSNKRKKFNVRGFVSVIVTLAFAMLAVSGVVLFLSPPGRIAHWTGWTILWLTKSQWSALHIWFAMLFLIASAFHIYLNGRALLGYFKSRLTRQLAFRHEWALAGLLSCVLFAAILAEIPPISLFLEWNEAFKESWGEKETEAPITHAELLSLSQLAGKAGMSAETMIANLRANEISVESADEIVGSLAKDNGMSPNNLYNIAVGKARSGKRAGAKVTRRGGGNGQKTLEQYCAAERVSLDKALERLRLAGIEADKEMLLRDIARKNDVHAPDLVTILKEETKQHVNPSQAKQGDHE